MGERRRGDDAISKAWAAMIVTVKIVLKTKDAEAPGVQCCCCGAAARREPKPPGIKQPTRAVAPWSPLEERQVLQGPRRGVLAGLGPELGSMRPMTTPVSSWAASTTTAAGTAL